MEISQCFNRRLIFLYSIRKTVLKKYISKYISPANDYKDYVKYSCLDKEGRGSIKIKNFL